MIRLQLPNEHTVLAFIRGDRESHALVALVGNRATPWATYLVRDDGMCFHGDYTRSEADARYSLLRRAGWAMAPGTVPLSGS